MLCLLPSAASGFEFRGFSDITYTATKNKQDLAGGGNSAFALGQFDLYVSQSLSDRVDILSELVVEANEVGEFGVDLERLQVGYIFSDEMRVWTGRFHNLLGYWNTAFHHGAQLQTTIERPQFLKFEDDGGILPVHVVGLWATGRFPTSVATLEYGIMAGNGAKIIDVDPASFSGGALDPNSVSDNNNSKAFSFRLRAVPSAIDGLGVGISGNFSKVQFFDSSGTLTAINGEEEVRQVILGADLEYLANNIQFLTEFYQISDKDSKTFQNHAWYVQGGYKIADRYTPYIRFEHVEVNENDPYFTALGTSDFDKTVVGIRFDIIPISSLKAEVRFVDGIGDHQEYAIQWAFGF